MARDLGLDSLARAELSPWLEKEFGFFAGGVESFQTVGDVLAAACGEPLSSEPETIKPVPAKWFTRRDDSRRFVKLGGEMISLAAVEDALMQVFPAEQDKGPALAVDVTG